MTTTVEPEEAQLSDLARRSSDLYDTQFKSALEMEHSGMAIAIHLDTNDHAVACSASDARQVLRGKHPQGFIWTRMVGPEVRQSLVRRILGARSLGQSTPDQ